MTGGLTKKLFIIVLTVLSAGYSYAQDNTIGTSWSPSGIGLTYSREIDEKTFAHAGIQLEMVETFMGRARYPGISASFTWNFVIKDMKSRNGTPVRIFAGPGFSAGMEKDFMTPQMGFFFGLKGRVGFQCIFPRNVDVSVSLAPILGLHVAKINDVSIMKLYSSGLFKTIMPEIGISYRF